MQILALINFAAAIQGIFLGYLIINRKSNGREGRILAALLIAMSLTILGSVLGLSGYYKTFPHLIRVADPLVFLFGPLLFFYMFQATRRRLPRNYYLHLAPFVLYLGATVPFYLLPAREKIQFGEDMFIYQKKVQLVIALQTVRTFHIGAYVLVSLILLRRFRRVVEQNYSNTDRFHLSRAQFLLRLFLALIAIAFGVYLISLSGTINLIVTNNLIGLAMGSVIYAFAYSTWNTVVPPEMYVPGDDRASVQNTKAETDRGRLTFNLNDDQFELLREKLTDAVENRKLYLEHNFSLTELSNELNILPYQTSELLSRHYNASFFEVVNGFRIDEVKRRLNDPSYNHYNIFGIALDCGFNSKSSFNATFKKFTGQTPSAFRESVPQE